MKKQLNYKSLNTLGDVDITQSVVPGGGEENESGGAEPTEYYSVNWAKLNELGYTDENFSNNASHFFRDTVFYCSIYKMTMRGNTMMVNINELWRIVTLAGTAFKYSYITAIAFTPYTEVFTNTDISSLKDIWTWTGQSFDEIFTPITKEQFYKLPVALTIYGPTEDDAIDYEDKMKTTFDTLWAIWERDGVEGQELAITIPNADIASITEISNEGTFAFNITSMMGGTMTSDSDTVTYIEFNGQYGPQIRKVENLITGEITYEYYYAA